MHGETVIFVELMVCKETGCEVDWSHLAYDGDKSWALVNTVMNISVS